MTVDVPGMFLLGLLESTSLAQTLRNFNLDKLKSPKHRGILGRIYRFEKTSKNCPVKSELLEKEIQGVNYVHNSTNCTGKDI